MDLLKLEFKVEVGSKQNQISSNSLATFYYLFYSGILNSIVHIYVKDLDTMD